MPPTYQETFPALRHVLLEESFVLRLDARETSLRFDIDACLLPRHPLYSPPGDADWACWRQGRLSIASPAQLQLRRSLVPPTIGPRGERDHGNLDTFTPDPDAGPDVWLLTGDWGEALVRAPCVELTILQ